MCICTGILTMNDLVLIVDELWSARSRWYNIGLVLGVSVDSLEGISHTNRGHTDICLLECIKYWLRQPYPRATWSAIIEALRSPAVGCGELAGRIERKYMSITKGWYECLHNILHVHVGYEFLFPNNIVIHESNCECVCVLGGQWGSICPSPPSLTPSEIYSMV